ALLDRQRLFAWPDPLRAPERLGKGYRSRHLDRRLPAGAQGVPGHRREAFALVPREVAQWRAVCAAAELVSRQEAHDAAVIGPHVLPQWRQGVVAAAILAGVGTVE